GVEKLGNIGERQAREHNGFRYVCCVEKGGAKTSFYHLNGPLLLFTSQEDMLRQALDAGRSVGPGNEAPLTKKFREVGAEKALVALWVNPRALDAEVAAKAAAAAGDLAPVLRHVAACWQALDGVAVWVKLERDLAVGLAVQARTEKLPPSL